MTNAPNRRWFQFRLRTLFVLVTIVACWLGYELNWIRQRHALLAQQITLAVELAKPDPQAPGESILAPPPGTWIGTLTIEPPRAPGLLWLFGEEGLADLTIILIEPDPAHPADEQREVLRAKKLFPEATVDCQVRKAKSPPKE